MQVGIPEELHAPEINQILLREKKRGKKAEKILGYKDSQGTVGYLLIAVHHVKFSDAEQMHEAGIGHALAADHAEVLNPAQGRQVLIHDSPTTIVGYPGERHAVT